MICSTLAEFIEIVFQHELLEKQVDYIGRPKEPLKDSDFVASDSQEKRYEISTVFEESLEEENAESGTKFRANGGVLLSPVGMPNILIPYQLRDAIKPEPSDFTIAPPLSAELEDQFDRDIGSVYLNQHSTDPFGLDIYTTFEGLYLPLNKP